MQQVSQFIYLLNKDIFGNPDGLPSTARVVGVTVPSIWTESLGSAFTLSSPTQTSHCDQNSHVLINARIVPFKLF